MFKITQEIIKLTNRKNYYDKKNNHSSISNNVINVWLCKNRMAIQ